MSSKNILYIIEIVCVILITAITYWQYGRHKTNSQTVKHNENSLEYFTPWAKMQEDAHVEWFDVGYSQMLNEYRVAQGFEDMLPGVVYRIALSLTGVDWTVEEYERQEDGSIKPLGMYWWDVGDLECQQEL